MTKSLSYYVNNAQTNQQKSQELVQDPNALKMLAKILAVKVLQSFNQNSTQQLEFLNMFQNDIIQEFSYAEGIGLADPYIYPMSSNIPVKLPDIEANYRLYQHNDTFINAEVSMADNNHKKRMFKFAKDLKYETNNVIYDGFFFSKFFIV